METSNKGILEDNIESKCQLIEDLPKSSPSQRDELRQSLENVKMAQEETALLVDQDLEKQELASQNDNYLECRICRCKDEEPLISPCKCSGSSKWIHQSCLVQWFQISRTSKCELCSENILVKKCIKPIREWKRPESSFGSCSKIDLWYLFVTIFSIGTIIGFAIFHSYVGPEEGVETTVVFIAIYILCALMIVIRVRYFYQWCTRRNPFWDEWRILNQEWNIQQERIPQSGQLEPRFIVEESSV